VREQGLSGHPAGDRPFRGGSLHHRLLTGPAAIAWAADHLHPQLRGDKVERGTLDTVAIAEGQLLDRLRPLPAGYLKALRAPASDVELARAQKWAAPTGMLRAYELYVRGRMAAYRATQDGSEAAVEFLSRAIEADPQFVAAQHALGVVHQNLGNRWKAAAQFRASAQLDPTYAEPYKALGDLYLTAPRRLFEEAIKAYAKAIELRPFYADAHVGLGDALAAKGDTDPAVAAYQRGSSDCGRKRSGFSRRRRPARSR